MGYRSVYEWRDLEDGHLYRIGEVYPFDGREVPEERIAELSGKHNKAGCALIEATPDKKPEKPATAIEGEKPGKSAVEDKPEQDKAKPAKRARTARKTAEKP